MKVGLGKKKSIKRKEKQFLQDTISTFLKQEIKQDLCGGWRYQKVLSEELMNHSVAFWPRTTIRKELLEIIGDYFKKYIKKNGCSLFLLPTCNLFLQDVELQTARAEGQDNKENRMAYITNDLQHSLIYFVVFGRKFWKWNITSNLW